MITYAAVTMCALLQGLDQRGLRHTAPLSEHVRLSVAADKGAYYPGELLRLTIAAENTSDSPIQGWFSLALYKGDVRVFYRRAGGTFVEFEGLLRKGLYGGRGPRTLKPKEKVTTLAEIAVTNLPSGRRAFILDATGSYEFKATYIDTPEDPVNGLLESEVVTVDVIEPSSSEREARAAYSSNLAYVAVSDPDYNVISAAEIEAAAEFIRRFPESRYTAPVKAGLRRWWRLRKHHAGMTTQERSLGQRLFPDDIGPVVGAVAVPPVLRMTAERNLVPITVKLDAMDDKDADPVVKLLSVSCDDQCEPAIDIGNAALDTDDRLIELRAARRGEGARVYTIQYSAEDAAGNKGTATTRVIVEPDPTAAARTAREWSSGITYRPGEVVLRNKETWMCVIGHRSATDVAPSRQVLGLWMKLEPPSAR
jgi:hypothetical protein